jgi:hypothetical protein
LLLPRYWMELSAVRRGRSTLTSSKRRTIPNSISYRSNPWSVTKCRRAKDSPARNLRWRVTSSKPATPKAEGRHRAWRLSRRARFRCACGARGRFVFWSADIDLVEAPFLKRREHQSGSACHSRRRAPGRRGLERAAKDFQEFFICAHCSFPTPWFDIVP